MAYFPRLGLGNDASITGNATIAANTKAVSRHVLGSALTFERAGFKLANHATNTTIRFLVYADTAGEPGELVAQSADVAITAADAYKVLVIPMPATTLQPGTYWLGVINGAAVLRYGYTTVSGTAARTNANTFAEGPSDPFGPASVDGLFHNASVSVGVEAGVGASKALAYAVVAPPLGVSVSKALAYAVLTTGRRFTVSPNHGPVGGGTLVTLTRS